MQEEQEPKNEKFVPSYSDLKVDKKFSPSYSNLKADKKFKPFYGRPRRSILNLIIDYYKFIIFLILLAVVLYFARDYF